MQRSRLYMHHSSATAQQHHSAVMVLAQQPHSAVIVLAQHHDSPGTRRQAVKPSAGALVEAEQWHSPCAGRGAACARAMRTAAGRARQP